MNVGTVTLIARAICEPAGIICSYEADCGRFRWNFYRDGERLKSIVKPSAVVDAAKKLLTRVNN